MDVSESEELLRVLREITEAMGAIASLLVAHADEDSLPRLLSIEDSAGLSDAEQDGIVREMATLRADETGHIWFRGKSGGRRHDLLVFPVHPVADHSRLSIVVLFDHLSEDAERRAEAVYLHRRPFAVGYFRLWQLDRTRRSRIAALEAALNHTELGVVLLDRTGSVSFANAIAAQLMDQGDGIRHRAGRLAATALREQLRLQVAIDHVVGAARSAQRARHAPLLMLPRTQSGPLIVSVLPVEQPALEPSDVAAILYIVDSSLDATRPLEPICKLYRLSPVETKLVGLLATGCTLADAAVQMHIKPETARSCLKQVFVKTGANRQIDLVRTILASSMRITRDVALESFT